MLKKIYLKELVKKNYLVLPNKEENKCTNKEVGALLKSFSSLGYTLDKDSILMLSELSSDILKDFYFTNYSLLEEIKGANVKHTVFYKYFPRVSHLSDEEMYVRAVLHYLTSSEESVGFMNQDLEDFIREEVHNPKKTTLKIISEEEAIKLIVNITNFIKFINIKICNKRN